MKTKQIIILILILTLISPIFSTYNTIYFNSKFDKIPTQTQETYSQFYSNNQTSTIIANKNPIYSSQNEYISKYSDLKHQLRINSDQKNYLKITPPLNTYQDYNKQTKTHISEREDYKNTYQKTNKYKIEYFKQNGYRFHSSEAHARNDY